MAFCEWENVLRSHSFFKRTGRDRKTEVALDKLNASAARIIKIALGALRLNHKRSSFGPHDLGVTFGITDGHEDLRVTGKIDISRSKGNELHGPFAEVGFHHSKLHASTYGEILDMRPDNTVANRAQPCFPIFAFPAMGLIGIDTKTLVSPADLYQTVEI